MQNSTDDETRQITKKGRSNSEKNVNYNMSTFLSGRLQTL